MTKALTNEVKTGIWVIICIIILLAFTVSVGKFGMYGRQYKIKVLFNWVAGVDKDAPVRLSGVEAGKVDDVKLIYKDDETKVLITLLLDSNARVREDSKAQVTTLGLMGEKYIELTSGSKGKPFLRPDSTIIGENPMEMEELIDIGKKIASEVEITLGDIRTLSKHLDEMVVANRGDIDDIIDNLRRTTRNFEEFSDDIKCNPWKLMIKTKEEKEDKEK